MIKANEVRIGNLVMMPSSDAIVPITAMDISDLQSNLKTRLPVRLTKNIILSSQFTQCSFIDDKFDAPMFGYHIIKHDDKFVFRGLGASIVVVKYLHHLQNLYFSLTGIELEINL